jgi:hypothetical protein
MADLQMGYELNQHITTVLNNIITDTGRQIERDNELIWDGFLHQLNNDDWAAMFAAFDDLVTKKDIFLTPHQQRKFQDAYTTFKRDKDLRPKCMDIRTKFKSTKDLAWAMIMIIREVVNASNGVNIPNVDSGLKPKNTSSEKELKTYRREYNITVIERLFEITP